jgi:endoglucanase
MDSQFNEVALDYNAGFTASLAWLCAHGLSQGQALSDAEFPPKEPRNESLDLLTTDREFFVSARRLGKGPRATQIEATLWNRSRWPSRVCTEMSFRYTFTLDAEDTPGQVQATVKGAGTARVGDVTLLAGRLAFVEVWFPGDPVYPGDMQSVRRVVQLTITSPNWSEADDWSAVGLDEAARVLPHIAVYDRGRLLGGEEPTRDR